MATLWLVMTIFEKISKWFWKKRFIHKLGPLLRNRYGRRKYYSHKQVLTTVHSQGWSGDYICVAYALYCSRDQFDAVHREMGEDCNYDDMRSEAVPSLYSHKPDFNADDVIPETSNSGSYSSGSDFGGDYGGFDGGGDGGGD